jgi:hypothetical protein
MTTKRQQTMAKITRERAVKEKREKKLEKKRERKLERKLLAENGGVMPGAVEGDEATLESTESELDPLLDPHQPDGDDGAVLGERVVPGL